MVDIEWTARRTILTGSFALVTVLILAIIGAVYCNILTIQGGSLLVSSVLTVATFGYVLLTFDMSRTIREQMQIQQRSVRLERRPDVKQAIENELMPLSTDVSNVRRAFSGPGTGQVDGEYYQAFPFVPTEFEDPFSVPRLLRGPIDIDPSAVADFYQTYKEYRQVYGDAVHELERLILSKLSDPPEDSDTVREYAMLALQLDSDRIRDVRWDSVKDDVIPLRKEIPELIQELGRLGNELHSTGGELSFELGEELTDVMNEFEIDESELNPDSVKSEWSNDETGQLGMYIGELPHRPKFADTVSEVDEDENEDTNTST